MRVILGLFILAASSACAETEIFICQANGFGPQPQITVRHNPTKDLLKFDGGYNFFRSEQPQYTACSTRSREPVVQSKNQTLNTENHLQCLSV